jgi:hypothetical protein
MQAACVPSLCMVAAGEAALFGVADWLLKSGGASVSLHHETHLIPMGNRCQHTVDIFCKKPEKSNGFGHLQCVSCGV